MMQTPNQGMQTSRRYAVFSIRKNPRNSAVLWIRAGQAWVNKDGSMNLYLDVLPLDGRLHVREAGERREILEQEPAPAAVQSAVESFDSVPFAPYSAPQPQQHAASPYTPASLDGSLGVHQ